MKVFMKIRLTAGLRGLCVADQPQRAPMRSRCQIAREFVLGHAAAGLGDTAALRFPPSLTGYFSQAFLLDLMNPVW